jgi:hypothetical protein
MPLGLSGVRRETPVPLSCYMVGVAQLVEHGIVTPVVEGSIPFVHPIFRKAPDLTVWRLFCFSGFSDSRPQLLGRSSGAFRRIYVSR